MSEDSNHIINVLLIKYLLQEATDDEILHVEEWIALSNDNKQYLDHFKLILNGSKTNKATTSLTEEEAWKRFEKRLDTTTSLINNKNKYSKFWYRVAALVIITFGIGLLVYNFLPKGETVKLMAVRSSDAVLSDTLPDQSVVTLNKHSQITYNSVFENDNRTVTLNGEAFFNVTPDKKKPFIIHVNDITVKVVGTSFNIRTKGTVTEVIVETGIVQVIKNKKAILVQPKEKVLVQQK
ncbi:MAG TPA: FecR family protein, partial [Chitinophagaceae bacterium]|nr:FecR family protein [Chitinophagaceae bacterium]